jgi:hypothetical protein
MVSHVIPRSRRWLMIGGRQRSLPFEAMISERLTVVGLAGVLRLVCDTAAVRGLVAQSPLFFAGKWEVGRV